MRQGIPNKVSVVLLNGCLKIMLSVDSRVQIVSAQLLLECFGDIIYIPHLRSL